jgi:hypothetical protein
MILPEEQRDLVDESTWNKTDLDFTLPENLTEKRVNGYILNRTKLYTLKNRIDTGLFEYFQDDFGGWTEKMFAVASRDVRRDFRDFLREHGVYLPKDTTKISVNLENLVKAEQPPHWTDEEIARQLDMDTTRIWVSRFNPNNRVKRQSIPTNSSQSPSPSRHPNSTRGDPTVVPPPPNDQSQNDSRLLGLNVPAAPSLEGWGKIIADMKKIYDDGKRFGGEEYDPFNKKLNIFVERCAIMNIPDTLKHNVFEVMLKGKAEDFYYSDLQGRGLDFTSMVTKMKLHFQTDEKHQKYLTEWRTITFLTVIASNPDKDRRQCLDILFDELRKLQRNLNDEYQGDRALRDQTVNACGMVPECNLATFKPAESFEAVCADLRASVSTALRTRDAHQYHASHEGHGVDANYHDQNWTDRQYGGRGRSPYRNGSGSRGQSRDYRGPSKGRYSPGFRAGYRGTSSAPSGPKKCFICKKPGCWSTNHTDEERRRSFNEFRQHVLSTQNRHHSKEQHQAFLAIYEGVQGLDNDLDEAEQLLAEMDFGVDDLTQFTEEAYFGEFDEVDGQDTLAFLLDQAAVHAFTEQDMFNDECLESVFDKDEDRVFTFSDRYSETTFQGIMPDTGASGVSTAGEHQFRALQALDPSIILDESTAGQHKIRFGKGDAISLGTTRVNTPVGTVEFHIVPANTPFLFCIDDMDDLRVRLDNIRNVLVKDEKKVVPVVRKWGHPWMLLHHPPGETLAWCHLTESQLRQLHRRFGHPAARRLITLLKRAGHRDIQPQLIKHLTKLCHHCQMNAKAPGRFKFTLKDDMDFNYEVVIDIMYIGSKPMLHVVDTATAFQAARFLKDISTKTVWDALRLCWIDVYLGPPDVIAHDAGKQLASTEFRQNARAMAIEVKEVPVEAHNSIGKVERYHAPLRRAYEIISEEVDATPEAILQMAVKAVNDTAGPNGLVPTLLVFGAYPRMTEDSAPSPTIAQRAEAVRKAMKEVRRLQARRQLNDGLSMRNGPDTGPTLRLPLQSEVIVWRENQNWTGPFTLLSINGETCTVEINNRPVNFRSTCVREYKRDAEDEDEDSPGNDDENDDVIDGVIDDEIPDEAIDGDTIVVQPPKRGRGRPKGSRNRVHFTDDEEFEHLEQYVGDIAFEDDFDSHFMDDDDVAYLAATVFLSAKEEADRELSLKLRREGKITTPGEPFEVSDNKELDDLRGQEVMRFVKFDPDLHDGRIFNSRMVREVKGKATDSPYEKSRLVIQGHSDDGKATILCQAPTIQRSSQRIMFAIAPTLHLLGILLWLRDITQAYVQAQTTLNRRILAHIPKELEGKFPPNTIMELIKPLYGIPEAGLHWWATYFKHHVYKLLMETSTYDPCLLITNTEEYFGVVGMQTDDTLILADEKFSDREEEERAKAKFLAKPKEKLAPENPLIFNGCILSQEDDKMVMRQKEQGKKISLVDPDLPDEDRRQSYVQQRARGAYIASVCQPEAAFDMSSAAQHQDPGKEEIAALNKRLKWQMEHLDRGLTYIPIDLATAKLYVFVDGSFANNKDLSSQIGSTFVLGNEKVSSDHEFTIIGNLIHWISIKAKRVTKSVLASEILAMSDGVDKAYAIITTLKRITDQLKLSAIQMVVCTDSYSLYECLVKLGSTKEKRLMIDIMSLRQSYERREILEIRWINGQDNPADAMTKANSNGALSTLIDTNSLTIRIEGWVKRTPAN